jgi:hypothetical protein
MSAMAIFRHFAVGVRFAKPGSFIGFSVGVHSGFAALHGSLGDEASSTRSYWLLTQHGALAIGMTRWHAEAMLSLSSTLRPVPDRIDPCREYSPKQIQSTIEGIVGYPFPGLDLNEKMA